MNPRPLLNSNNSHHSNRTSSPAQPSSRYSKDLPPAPAPAPAPVSIPAYTHTLDPLHSAPLPAFQPSNNENAAPLNSSDSMAPKSLRRRNFKQLALSGPSLTAAPRQTSYTVLPVDSSAKAAPVLETQTEEKPNSTKVFCIEAQEQPLENLNILQGDSRDHELLSQFSTLELNVEFKLDLRAEDIQVLSELGSGNGGTVSKAQHLPTGLFMARKVIPIEAKTEVRKQIVRELHIMHDCNFSRIVSYYGAFLNEGDVVMCMEYMDKGSFDRISRKLGPIDEEIVGKVTEAVVEGLDYLYDKHRIIHRDVKPSNILLNHQGQIKICDFGVSGELNNSVADTFVGTSTYMSPERIQGAAYSVKSDVWSLGITLLELAIGYFPWDGNGDEGGNRTSSHPMGILDMLQRIVLEPPPQLPAGGNFTDHFRVFIKKCLMTKDNRPTPKDLFVSYFLHFVWFFSRLFTNFFLFPPERRIFHHIETKSYCFGPVGSTVIMHDMEKRTGKKKELICSILYTF